MHTLKIHKIWPQDVNFELPEQVVNAAVSRKDVVSRDKGERKKQVLVLIAGGIFLSLGIWLFTAEKPSKESLDDDKVATKAFQADIDEIAPKTSHGTSVASRNDNIDMSESDQERELDSPFFVFEDTSLGSINELDLPRGMTVRAMIENEVDLSLRRPIVATTFVDVVIDGEIVIPKGSKIFGRARGIREGRVFLAFNEITTPDGDYKISAEGFGNDGTPGVFAHVDNRVGQRGQKAVSKSLLSAASGSMRLRGGGFGSIFAGELAGEAADGIDDDFSMNGVDRARVVIPENSLVRVVF